MSRDPLAVDLKCVRCATIVARVNRAKVAQYRKQFGGSLMLDETVVDLALNAMAFRCPKCDTEAHPNHKEG